MGISEGWSLRYYDQHHEPHGLGVMVSDQPAFMQATEHPSGKALRYYADKERTDREVELENIAKKMLNKIRTLSALCIDGYDFQMKLEAIEDDTRPFIEQLEDLGVDLNA